MYKYIERERYIYMYIYIYYIYIYIYVYIYIQFPAQKCCSIKKNLHETGSLSEKVHGCRILP